MKEKKKLSCWSTVTKAVKKIDVFGYRIEINFNNKGSSHKTFPGGISSILFMALMIYLTITYSAKLILANDD